MLAPLCGLVSPTVKYRLGNEQQAACEEAKKKTSQENLLEFPDFHKELMCILIPPVSYRYQ
jgi:hypothetical protein